MSNNMMRQEIWEAVKAGERALQSLNAAAAKLDSAKNWGLLDLFGGGFITDLVKHSKINDASGYLEDARADLRVFQRELRDVSVPLDVHLDMGGFLNFADFFLDGLAADYLVQSRIIEAKAQVAEAVRRVEYLLSDLKRIYGQEED